MKKMIFGGILFVTALCEPMAWSQGVTYLSSLGSSLATEPVAGDSWVAADFDTGNNPGGYLLDTVELQMDTASGNPNGFTVELYSLAANGRLAPGAYLASLSGSTDPASAGLYTFASSGITLASDSTYFIVVTAETAIASGSFTWGLENPLSNTSSDGWGEGAGTDGSIDGSYWNLVSNDDPQFALTATAVPEPDAMILFGLPGLLWIVRRRICPRPNRF